MNVYEAIRVLLAVSGIDGAYTFHPAERRITIIAAQSVAAEITSKYDALAPDWANAPDWAQWYAIDSQFWSNGTAPACFYQNEPHLDGDEWSSKIGEQMPGDSSVEIPLGIDWRLCKWQRPEAA